MKSGMKRISGIIFIIALILILVVPPLVLRTSTYPLAVVNGNSMYPLYRNGELVIFSLNGVNVNDIPNGTDIVYIQTETGIPMFSAITAHPIAHQVIKRIVNQYGNVYYQTKGINNLYPDPLLVPANHVLGVVVNSEPYAGYPFMYASEPSGTVMIIGLIVIMYVGSVERAFNRQKMRQKFIGELYKLVEERKLTEKRFN
ncbi:MAG: signal peptidase I, partial [Candidatus Thermoplasmatota archaeon]|nr:signal peptidase I [Candidatus Thermoplasmatota archaeon]